MRKPDSLTLNRETLRSRSFWNGLAMIAVAALNLAGIAEGPITEGTMAILAGLAVIFVRDSVSSLRADSAAAPVASGDFSPGSGRR